MAKNDSSDKLQRPDLSAAENDYLRILGERIRDLRARRGMTRKTLAQDSGVSERYLAQLETGHGNISIILLRQIAQAMGNPLPDLVREEPEQPVELTLLTQFLSRLPPKKLAKARNLLITEFDSKGKTSRRRRIALIGMRGAGKTTLGTMLALRLGVPFLELAKVIESDTGTPIPAIFALYGQAAYRRYERRSLESVIESNEAFVLTPGGGIVSEPATFDLLLSSCHTIWIKTSPEEHMARVTAQGDTRPMGSSDEAMQDLQRILAGRAALYNEADAVLETSGKTTAQSFSELLELLGAA
ncbi:MAG: helix-turn-helix transcriptional regulator [Proteobacteria bacterium]|nr:helix-turn-helix transcriptional regulator [Pseudomonadota bacterium]